MEDHGSAEGTSNFLPYTATSLAAGGSVMLLSGLITSHQRKAHLTFTSFHGEREALTRQGVIVTLVHHIEEHGNYPRDSCVRSSMWLRLSKILRIIKSAHAQQSYTNFCCGISKLTLSSYALSRAISFEDGLPHWFILDCTGEEIIKTL